jgi:hypothetical protein
MSYFARRQGRDWRRRRPVDSGWVLESLEGRRLLSSEAGGTSAPVTVLAGSSHVQVPTITVLQTSKAAAETAEDVTLVAIVQNANKKIPVNTGKVKFVLDSPTHSVLAQIKLNKSGEAGLTTAKLVKTGTYQIEADYVPPSSRFASSESTPVTITVSPLSATSFRVTPEVRHGHLNEPLTFTVNALQGRHELDTGYTGTVNLSSPTDSWTVFPKGVYESLAIQAPSPQTTGLASFSTEEYTFTPADHGSHTFVGGVTFQKGGAELVEVTQANDKKVHGEATISIS